MTLSTHASGRCPQRILLVDDNEDCRFLLIELLQLWGHTVEAVGDGPAALRAIQQRAPDVALIDISLPGMDGFHLVEQIRRLPGTERILLVAFSGYNRPDPCSLDQSGFHEYLVKPLDLDSLDRLLLRHGLDRRATTSLP